MSASAPVPVRRGPSRWKLLFWLLVVPAALITAYFFFVLNWNYSTGERAGWIQKFSRKGWLCKTWEGEMAMVTMPGAAPEKFLFTVWDDQAADAINKVMGKRVSLYYEEKVGLPSSCFGETRYFVKRVSSVEDIPMVAPGLIVPPSSAAPASSTTTPGAPASAAPATTAPAPASPATTAPSTPPASTAPPPAK